MTICIRCRHHAVNTRGGHNWWNHCCKANPRQSATDPVTGSSGYIARNDLQNLHFTDEQYPHCRSINYGNCPHYEAE